MKATFWGATRQVTGSMHMLDLQDDFRILIDCGLDYENSGGEIEGNREFPFDPRSIDALILTHAHIDHSGNIPNLVRQGFKGPIYCTEPTGALTDILLRDSLKIQSKGSKKKKKHKNKNKETIPLYNRFDIDKTLNQMEFIGFGDSHNISESCTITFQTSGHILGAVSVLFENTIDNKKVRVAFTGDLGNYNSKLVPDPLHFSDLDYLISESTYGGKFHAAERGAEDEILFQIESAIQEEGDRLIIPAFSVGRTQAILFTLNQLYEDGRLDPINVYTDSPLALYSTEIYDEYRDYLNEESIEFSRSGNELFDFPWLTVVDDKNSKDLLKHERKSHIIVSAAGMVEGGRIKQHVRNNIRDPRATILIAGYCSEGTLGDRLLKGGKTIYIHKKEHEVIAKIRRTDAFSAHPDHNGLLHYFSKSISKSTKKLFLVHGNYSGQEILKGDISGCEVLIPERGNQFDLL
jgi:metallo-beta-lactamase family protein